MIEAVIIDDEKSARDTLKGLVRQFCPEVQLIGEAASANQAHQLIEARKPALLFLDIRMPFGNGLDLLKAYEHPGFEVIFTTAYSEYALHALRLSALDYLLKPIDIGELQEAVRKAAKALALRQRNERYITLLSNLDAPAQQQRVVLPFSGGYQVSSFSEIVRLEASKNYSWVVFANGERLLCSRTLKDFEGVLAEHGFLRVHQSHLVNTRFIRTYHKGRGGTLTLSNGEEIEVARSRKQELLKFIDQLE